MKTAAKEKYIKDELNKKGFNKLPSFIFSDSTNAVPLVLLTNCCIYPFTNSHRRTSTKTYYSPTGQEHLLNVTASAAIKLIERGRRVIVHLPAGVEDRVEELFLMHPANNLISFIRGDIYSFSFVENLYSLLKTLTKNESISKLDMCPYDSYASGLEKPFLPMFEDSPVEIKKMATKRIDFLFNLSLVAYDLLINRGQKDFRLVCPTALATQRPSTHLFTDTLHKSISNVLLQTLGYEMPYYTQKPVSIIEVAPGIVDTGLYDTKSVRDYTAAEAEIDGFPMKKKNTDDIRDWPMISISDLAEIVVAYLVSENNPLVNPKLNKLTLAGRGKKELFNKMRETINFSGSTVCINKLLPEYCYTPGTVWGGFPKIKNGYVPVMLTPPGQLF